MDGTIYEDWIAEINKRLEEIHKTESIPSMVKRCPKCKNLSLEFDPEHKKIHCTKCGFQQALQQ